MLPLNDADRFNNAVDVVLSHEGGLVDNKSDPGGITKYGISYKFIFTNNIDVNNDKIINRQDILDLTRAQASEIYKEYWWDKYHYNNINNLSLATKIFDLSINIGPMNIHKIAQQSINVLTNHKIAVDGVLGPMSFQYLNKLDTEDLRDEISTLTIQYYDDKIDKNPGLAEFRQGWHNRADWWEKM